MEKKIQTYNSIFWDYVSRYDASDSNILRKIIHSYTVANTCFTIACRLKLSRDEREFAYLVGLFHDVGRFYQWEHYGTYNDKVSIDHGDVGADILAKINEEQFGITAGEKSVLIDAVKYHTKPYTGNNDRVILFNEIVKNADAFSNVVRVASGAFQNMNQCDGFNEEILNDFNSMNLLLKYNPHSKLDFALLSMASAYYVKYDFLRQEILHYGYIDIMCNNFGSKLNDDDVIILNNAVRKLKENYLLDNSIIKTN